MERNNSHAVHSHLGGICVRPKERTLPYESTSFLPGDPFYR